MVVNGEMTLVTEAPASANLEGALDTVYSGLLFRDLRRVKWKWTTFQTQVWCLWTRP